ncbi:TnsA endonuclease N-terminal domain-containing protein [Bariatricus sp. HCP28S3_E4]|uniref:TnsA endonuclease N-terminal domain-containing protein n=1 Tax=unclassified Bariatricus TaxID=2677046 RepID=UPI003F8C8005
MGKRKTNKAKLAEGRCQGIGPDYVPFYKANEGGSQATTSMIPDPIEGRMIHCLSDTETMMYYLLRWNTEVLHIREQYLLNHERVNDVRSQLGYSRVPEQACFTTDFLVDFKDGSQQAYSVKFRTGDFNPNAIIYKGREHAYARLIERQNTERLYWESQDVKFNIVTRDDLMQYRIQIKNIAFVMRFWDDTFIVNRQQKLLYLIAHHIVVVSMDKEFINPKQLADSMSFDIDAVYAKTLEMRRQMIGE